jgi:hypothetical protein
MFGYVRPNIVKKTSQKIYRMPFYVSINVAMKRNWQSLTKLANANGNNDFENDNFGQNFDFYNSQKLEKIIEENSGETLVQNILNHEQIIDGDSKTLTIPLRESFRPLGIKILIHFYCLLGGFIYKM